LGHHGGTSCGKREWKQFARESVDSPSLALAVVRVRLLVGGGGGAGLGRGRRPPAMRPSRRTAAARPKHIRVRRRPLRDKTRQQITASVCLSITQRQGPLSVLLHTPTGTPAVSTHHCVCLSVCLSVRLSVHHTMTRTSICTTSYASTLVVSTHYCVCLSVCLSACISDKQSVNQLIMYFRVVQYHFRRSRLIEWLTCSRQVTSRPGSRLAMPGSRRGRRGGASVTTEGGPSLAQADRVISRSLSNRRAPCSFYQCNNIDTD